VVLHDLKFLISKVSGFKQHMIGIFCFKLEFEIVQLFLGVLFLLLGGIIHPILGKFEAIAREMYYAKQEAF